MASNQQGGSGGPWGGGGGNKGGGGPWGGGGNGSGGGNGPQPPDIDELIRQGQDKVKQLFPSGAGGARGIVLLVLAAIVLWGLTGIYKVAPGEQGVQLLFGKYMSSTSPGLHYWAPEPVGTVYKPNVDRTNTITVGSDNGRRVLKESLMLTGDQNIVDLNFVVQWRIKDAAAYLFNIRNPQGTIKIAAESSMREIIGQTTLQGALTDQRAQVEQQSRELLQSILDSYGSGVIIAEVKLQEVDPPREVIDAFNDVQRAKQDEERSINEAQTYLNDIVPKAKGQGEKIIQHATAYKEKIVAEAEGEAQRFISVYDAYLTNKEVTRRRLYLERMQEIFKNSDTIIIDGGVNGSGVVPYLPLNELNKSSGGSN